jgi:methylmalonyl-CoA mutase C-terminal domain/subunit
MNTAERKVRIVLAKPGLDGHTRGIQHVARSMREAGIEVIYLGLYQSPEQVVRVAVDEDADAIGISVLSGAPVVAYCQQVVERLAKEGASDVSLLVGGIIRPDEREALGKLGVDGVFGPGTPMSEILDHVKARLRKHDAVR